MSRLMPGTVIDGYRLGVLLGQGIEGTVYAAVERYTGLPFALKLLHARGREAAWLARRMAWACHRLRGTGVVATYHRSGRAGAAVYLLFDRLEGEPLTTLLGRRRWPRGYDAGEACLLLAGLARKLAVAHRHGVALGDFSQGNNILLRDGCEPVFCDLDVGEPGFPNRDYGFDLELFAEIATALARVRPPCPTLQHIAWLASDRLDRPVRRSSMTRLAAAIGSLPL